MKQIVLDTSAVLAVIFEEPGQDAVLDLPQAGLLSAVNLAEARSRLADRGFNRQQAEASLQLVSFRTVDFDAELAAMSADLRTATKQAGLSLGDRACLALAQQRDAIAVTADRAWAHIQVPVEVQFVR